MPPREARLSTSKGRSKATPGTSDAPSTSIADSFAQALARKPPKSGRIVHSANVEYRYRASHTMFGHHGHSQVSNDFLSEILAVLIARHGMSPAQSGVLVFCMGRQREGTLQITHLKIAKHLGIERANVTRALGRLESWHMVRRRPNSLIIVNPLICFMGNGDIQQSVLGQLRTDAAQALRDAFPQLREDAAEEMFEESFPAFQAPAIPKPRTRQLEFDDTNVEGQAC